MVSLDALALTGQVLSLSWSSANGPSFLEQAENVDISRSNVVAAARDYNNNNHSITNIFNFNVTGES
jgi:hypothetical protein